MAASEHPVEFYKSPEKIAQQWLDASATSATQKQFEAHFNLISKKVRITGVPGFESIGYDDWARATKADFESNTLDRVEYAGLNLTAHNDTQIMFKTLETIFASDGTKNAQGVEVLLEKEDDGVWRVIQERVMTSNETQHVGLF